jgi:hypothetical protein
MRERKPFDPGLGASAGLSEVAQWPVPAGRLDMGALEPQMFPFLFSNPFALAVGLRGSRTSLEHRRQSGLSQALGSSARIEGVS